ncbi:MAG: hypothetical protein GX428_08740 [Candidatus Atribacteria bacterium]|nr:hypothetical protein [Candidatus Atribacteria bacterium]
MAISRAQYLLIPLHLDKGRISRYSILIIEPRHTRHDTPKTTFYKL